MANLLASRINVSEKRLELISFKAPLGTTDWLRSRAAAIGLTISSYCLSMVEREALNQAFPGQPGQSELLALVDQARRETQMALADGRVTASEKARISKPATKFMHRIWNDKL